jgi:hypothetical protein
MNRFVRQHWLALSISIMVGLVAGLPQIIAKHTLGPDYQGMPYLVANDSEPEYVARIQEIIDGHWSVSSPMLYEYKDSTALMPPTGEFLFYFLPVTLLRVSLPSWLFFSKFLYPTLLFFFAYLFVLSLLTSQDTGAKTTAAAGALMATLGYDGINIRAILSYLIHRAPISTSLLWTRPVNPITGAILLVILLWFLSNIFQGRNSWRMVVGAGLVLGAMSGYIFSFALALIISGLLGLYFLWQKHWSMLLKLWLPIIIGLGLNAIYAFNVIFALRGKVSLSNPLKTGMILTHVPLLNAVSYIVLGLVILLSLIFFKRDVSPHTKKRWWFFVAALAVACVGAYSQQIITGRAIWPQHFVQYTKPLGVLVLAVLIHNVFRYRIRIFWQLSVLGMLVIPIFLGWRILDGVGYTIAQYRITQSYAGVIQYLNSQAPKDCVVYVSSDPFDQMLNRFIPALTQCNDYHTYYLYNGVPNDRILHNYLVELRFNNLKTKDVAQYYNAQRFYTTSYFFRDWRDMLCCENDRWLAQVSDKAEIDRWFIDTEKTVEQAYTQFLKKDFYTELTKYRLDYVVVDTSKQPFVNDKNFSFLKLKGVFGQYKVYSVTHE